MLCDAFEKFIKTCLNYYNLDLCHYFSSPALSWDAMLKMTSIKLELISDTDMHLFIEKGMRGRIHYIAKRYSKADKNKRIMYWGANNLYRLAMNQSLPCCNFKFVTKKEINEFNLDSTAKNSSVGYVLECGLEYCNELRDSHPDDPLCPEKIEISSDMSSKNCKEIADKYGIKVGHVKKLVPCLIK